MKRVNRTIAQQLFDAGMTTAIANYPTLHEVADFIRKKGLHVAVNITHDGWYWQVIVIATGGCLEEESFIDTHDTALLSAIKHALNKLKQGK